MRCCVQNNCMKNVFLLWTRLSPSPLSKKQAKIKYNSTHHNPYQKRNTLYRNSYLYAADVFQRNLQDLMRIYLVKGFIILKYILRIKVFLLQLKGRLEWMLWCEVVRFFFL